MIAPKFDSLSEKETSVKFVKVNVEDADDVAGMLGVEAMPTFLFFKKGAEKKRVVGADISAIEKAIKELQAS
jgi:thioredoxin 1